MQGLILHGPRHVEHHTDLPDPTIEADTDAIVGVRLAGLCGSDLHPYLGRERVRADVVPGHEAVGEVVATGTAVRDLQVGDRVAVPFTTSCGRCGPCSRRVTARCEAGQLFGYADPDALDAPVLNGAQAQLLRVPLADTTALVVPPAVRDELALLLTDNLPTAWEAVQRAAPAAGEPLAVVGLGAVGLCAVAAARAIGAEPVVAIDPVAGRRNAAEQLGAAFAAAPDDERVAVLARDGGGLGAVVEASGATTGQRLAFELLRPGATLSVIAVQTTDRFAFTPVDAYDRNVTVRAGRASVRAVVDDVVTALVAGALTSDVTSIVTHRGVALEEGPSLYERFADRQDGLIKAAFSP